ncbi:hypothetical protein MYU51_011331 [Penicillium brevicompactum]
MELPPILHGQSREMPLLMKYPSESDSADNSDLESIPALNPPPHPLDAPSERLEGLPHSSPWHPKPPFLLLLHEADTLVFIDPSPEVIQARQPCSTRTVPHRIHSERLLATGSTYFQHMFSSSYQTRIINQRGLLNGLPAGIKYVLDLTPPLLDDDALILLAELSCPRSVREWASKKDIWSLPDSCVGGVDEMEAVGASTSTVPVAQNAAHQHEQKWDNSREEADNINPQSRNSRIKRSPMEYSPQRHREGIEHILHVLMGLNPTLDTPCKMWTFFGLAKFFDVVTVPVISDHIISWFYELNNIRFIELHPEVVYWVACGTKSVELCRGAFAELVGDAALLYLLRMAEFTPSRGIEMLTWNPARNVLDDGGLQRIEYASQSFGESVIRCFAGLAGTRMDWIYILPECQKLVHHLTLHPEDLGIINPIINTLKEYLRDQIYGLLADVRDTNRSFHADSSGRKFLDLYYRYIDKAPGKDFYLQRLIGQDFWTRLGSLDLYTESLIRKDSHTTIAEICPRSLALSGETDAIIRHVSHTELSEACREFNLLSLEKIRLREMQEEEAVPLVGERRILEMTIVIRQAQINVQRRLSPFYGPILNPIPAPHPYPCLSAALPQRQDPIKDYIFNECDFRDQAEAFLTVYSEELLKVPDISASPHVLADVLSCLTYNEYQYLPLWAGGNDDGTGGVFSDLMIPNVDAAEFPDPGLDMYTGSVASSSSLIEVDEDDDSSTIRAASHRATYSHASDLLSIESINSTQASVCPDQLDEAQLQQYGQFDDEGSVDFGLTTDEELEIQSDCTLVDESSPIHVGSSEGMEMDNSGQDSGEFEFI